jgi:WD40 repeat protein
MNEGSGIGEGNDTKVIIIIDGNLQVVTILSVGSRIDQIENAKSHISIDSAIASGSDDRTVKIWDIRTGQCLDTYLQHTAGVSAVTFSPDGITLASESGDRTVRLWNYHTGICMRTIYGHANQIFSLDFSPDAQTIVCVSLAQTMRIWDCRDGKCLKTWKGSTDWVFPVAFNSQGNLIASGSNDRTIRIWDWENTRLGNFGSFITSNVRLSLIQNL